MVPSPTTYHQRISWNLGYALGDFVRSHDLGVIYNAPLDVVFSQEDVAQPDILFIAKQKQAIITKENIQGAPDLIIEILSPATAERDKTYKRTLYARYGVKEYWLVDPDKQSIEVLELGENGFEPAGIYSKKETFVSPLLQGICLDLEKVF